MKYKYVSDTGIQVSELCFGVMSFGGDADEAMSKAMYHRCREAGINFFDCADMYQKGRAEEILGELIAHERDKLIITTKGYFPMGDDVNARGASRRHLIQAVNESLTRLRTDYIDIYYIHHFDEHTGLADTLGALDDLVHQGKIRYTGASNFAAWQVMKAIGISAAKNFVSFKCIQPMYSLVKRQSEVELLPLAVSEGLAVMPYNVLGAGMLSGKYGAHPPTQGRLITNKTYASRYRDPDYWETARKFTEFAQQNGYNPVSLAIAWAAGHPAVTAPIIGARSVLQLEDSLNSVSIEMTPELREQISALSKSPPPATDRSE